MNFLNELNQTQQDAVMHTDGPLLIFAGAGSGKTRVLTYRVARLINDGVDPYHIIAITFTNKAAREMRERISNITPLGEQVWVSTFHAACTRILRREIEILGYGRGFSIYDTQDSLRLIKDCIKEQNLSESHYSAKYVAKVISARKNELVTPAEYINQVLGKFRESNVAEVYALYQKRLKDSNALDFDDIIMQTVEMFRTHENVRVKYQNRFKYVLVDEYQDTNHAQYELVGLLSGEFRNLCVVGDDDQSIYRWRGADVRNILRFDEDYPDAKVVKLEQNYRSKKVILDAANAVIAHNSTRAEKLLWTENGRGEPVRLYNASDERDEGAFVARAIREEIKKGAKWSDFAVLYRTNAQSRSIEDQFVTAGIPYRIYSGVRFYEHTEVKDILAYLKAINNPADDLAFLRIINVPRRGIGAATIDKIRAFAIDNGLGFFAAMSMVDDVPGIGRKAVDIERFVSMMNVFAEFAMHNTVAELIKKINNVTEYTNMLDDGTTEGEDRIANVRELIAKARAFEKESKDATLASFLEEVALVADIDNYDEGADTVSLMTMHSAKGLEFDSVFVVGLEENLFPSFRSIDSGLTEEMEEERRLCYVSFTRAKRLLYLSNARIRRRYDQIARNLPSRFLSDISRESVVKVDMYGEPKETWRNNDSARVRTVKPASKAATVAAPKSPPPLPTPTDVKMPYSAGEKVQHWKYGIGKVKKIKPGGADFEVTVEFPKHGTWKFMTKLSRLTKVSEDV